MMVVLPMRISRNFQGEDVRTTLHHFAVPGDALPLHSHAPGLAHFTMCVRGKVRVFGDGWERVLQAAGAHETRILKILPGQLHGIQALEPDSMVVNMIYNEDGHEGAG